jgi:hypothetical protein
MNERSNLSSQQERMAADESECAEFQSKLENIITNPFKIMDQNLSNNFNQSVYDIKKTPWSESASVLYRPSDRRLSAK